MDDPDHSCYKTMSMPMPMTTYSTPRNRKIDRETYESMCAEIPMFRSFCASSPPPDKKRAERPAREGCKKRGNFVVVRLVAKRNKVAMVDNEHKSDKNKVRKRMTRNDELLLRKKNMRAKKDGVAKANGTQRSVGQTIGALS